MGPAYLSSYFKVRSSTYQVRWVNKLAVAKANTTTYGLHSFRYLATSTWNCITDKARSTALPPTFKRQVWAFSSDFNLFCL